MKAKVEKWVTKMYGRRCKAYIASCPTCRVWSSFDYLFMTTNETMWIKHRDEMGVKK